MLSKMLACGKVYISASRNRAALESIEQAAKLFPEAAIVNKFVDAALETIDFELQSGTVPTFLYGAAEERGRLLDSVRRELGYFKPNSGGIQWAGVSKSESLPLKPDADPTQVSPAKGVIVIGASNCVANYNVPVFSTYIAAVRRIAKQVSERGGGLPSVQAMGLAHGDGVTEVACNLLEPSKVGGDRVLQVERLAKEEGLSVGKGYFTDLTQDKIIESYMKLSSF
ncbi:hypothetical protein CRYUN_Cryun10bG0072700 [Craigia yunnanensis]